MSIFLPDFEFATNIVPYHFVGLEKVRKTAKNAEKRRISPFFGCRSIKTIHHVACSLKRSDCGKIEGFGRFCRFAYMPKRSGVHA